MKWIVIFKNILKRNIVKKNSFTASLLLPVIVVILGIGANIVSEPSLSVGILDLQQDEASENAIRALESTKGIKTGNADPATLETDIRTGRFAAVIQFSENGFGVRSVKDSETIDKLAFIARSYLAAPKPIELNMDFDHSLGIPQRVIAFLVLFLLITATLNASLLIKDKSNGTFQRFLYSPCTAFSYVFGNIIYNFTITYLQFFIAVTIVSLFKFQTGITYPDFLLMGIWTAALATAFGTCIASFFKNDLQANMMASCIALILSLIGGTFISLYKMPAALQALSVLSPLRWFIEAVDSMVLGGKWFSNLKCVGVLSLFVIALFITAVVKNRSLKKL